MREWVVSLVDVNTALEGLKNQLYREEDDQLAEGVFLAQERINKLGRTMMSLSPDEENPLKFEEVRNLKKNTVVWIEELKKEEIIPGIVMSVNEEYPLVLKMAVAKSPEGIDANLVYYGFKWRLWMKNPNEEQRERAEWNGGY